MGSEFQQPISGSLSALDETIDITGPNSGTSIIQVTGTWSGSIVLEGSNDNSNWNSFYTLSNSSKLFVSSIDSNGLFTGPSNGFQFLRLRASAWTSGTANLNVYGSDAASLISTDSQIRGSSDGKLVGNVENNLLVSNFLHESVKGSILNHKDFPVTGFSTTVSSSGKTVWDGPGFYTFPTAAETLEVFSASANDTSTGTGAVAINIQGLDSNYDEISETVVMSGTSVVTTTALFLRVNLVFVVSTGSSETNEGEITIRNSSSQTILAIVGAEKGLSSQVVATVPNGRNALLYGFFILNSKAGTEATIMLRDGATGTKIQGFNLEIAGDQFSRELNKPVFFGEKTDVWLNSATKSGTTSITGVLDILLAG